MRENRGSRPARKQKSYRGRLRIVKLQEKRSTSKAVQEAADAEMRRQGIRRATHPILAKRAEFIVSVLLDPRISTSREFGVQFTPYSSIAPGPEIHPYADIFDQFVGTSWNVRVELNLAGTGMPGWMFSKH